MMPHSLRCYFALAFESLERTNRTYMITNKSSSFFGDEHPPHPESERERKERSPVVVNSIPWYQVYL